MWTPENPNTGIPAYSAQQQRRNSSRWIDSAAYFRLKNLSFGYEFPYASVSKLNLNRLYLFLTATNLFTITKFPGYDPEASIANESGLRNGINLSSYPGQRSFTLGLQLNF